MTEAELLEYSRPVVDVYTAMEHDLMVAVAAQIAKDGFVSATSKWRMQKLAEAGELNRTAVNIIASYTGIQSDVLTEAITSAAYDVIDNIEPALQAAARDGVISDADVSASASAKRVISTYRKQAKSDLNLVNTVMRYKAKEAYVDLVNRTYDAVNAIEDVPNMQELLNTLGKHTMSAVTGAESRSAAVRKCIQEFNAKGIPAFVDAAGRQWSPEAYVNMDIKTTVSNVAHAAQDARCDEYDIDLIEVSSHKGARPKCAPYQGRIFSRSNKSGIAHDGSGREIQYSPLSETSYGEPDGLFGINCHHKKYPFIDGVNFQRYFPYEKDENDAYYAALQKQRQLERRIREQKREIDMLKEIGDDEGVKAARAKLREQQAKYKEFSEKNDLAMRKSRTAVSRKNTQKPLDSGGGSGIIEVGSENVALEFQRYGRNKDTLVNKTYIDSGEYRKKFDKLTDNPTVNKTLYECSKAALKHRSGTELEDMYWLDGKTGKIILSVTDSKEERAIIYTEKIKHTISQNENIVTLHTHPSSMPPSIDDFNSCYKNKYDFGIVVCHNGRVFKYSSQQLVSKSLYNLYIGEYVDNGHTEFDAQIKSLEKLRENHMIHFEEV